MQVILVILLYAALINVTAFVLYAHDKLRAQNNGWRTPERTLLLVAVAGGGIGAFAGMRLYHHKTRKAKFRVVTLLMVVQVLIVGSLIALLAYTATYYHADDTALAALESDNTVTVSKADQSWLFDGPGSDDLLVFYPGGKVQTEAYAPLMYELASCGVDCALVDVPLHLAFLGLNRAEVPIMSSDYAHYYVGGHSLGGVAAASFAAHHTKELTGLVLLASYATDDLSQSGLAALSIYGTNDGVLNHTSYEQNRDNLPADAVELKVAGGNHAQFGNYGEQTGDGQATISAQEQQHAVAEAICTMAAV